MNTLNRNTWKLAASFALLSACGTQAEGDDISDPGAGGKADDVTAIEQAVCLQRAVHPNQVLADVLKDADGALNSNGSAVIANYTAWPVYDPNARSARIDADVTRRIKDPEEARSNIASRYGDCEDAVNAHLATKPNVYVYFSGFGGADQNNSIIGQGAVLRWINERDPNALIFSINWNCAASDDPFCAENTAAIAAPDDAPQVVSMNRAIDTIVPQIASKAEAEQFKALVGEVGRQQRGYDSAHSHSMELAAKLIDQLIVADVGDIHIAGYSMGAHSAAQLLVQDFTGTGGFEWSADACEDGGNTCTVAGLSKVKWSLAMGLSGWSHALQTQKDADAATQAQYQNGGLYRADDSAYRGKLAVLNRRMDPTSNSDDTFQRGFLDVFFADYNHYSHDYDLPLFIDTGFLRVLDAFLENPDARGVREIGIVADNASKVDFDDCTPGTSCEALTGYIAHIENRSHADLEVPRVEVETTDGVKHAEKRNNAAAALTTGDTPIELRTFEQEDLRGGVEFYLRPNFDLAATGVHGLFSYGSCAGSDDDLMPQAWIEDGSLVMSMQYQGEEFEVRVDAKEAGLRTGEWSHLAFNWELPVESLSPSHDNAEDLVAALPGMKDDLAQHKVALVLATGLTKPLPTTYKRQRGEGAMTIYVNGNEMVQAPLGDEESARECLAAAEVLSDERYAVNKTLFPAFNPYAGYDRQNGDVVALSADQIIGSKCKAYRVRNTTAFFGCAQSEEVNLDADLDDVTLIWGPGRTDFDNVDHDTGAPKTWPIGVDVDADPIRK